MTKPLITLNDTAMSAFWPALTSAAGLKLALITWGRLAPGGNDNCASKKIPRMNCIEVILLSPGYDQYARDTTMKVLNVVGARPNFMKIAPLVEQMKKTPETTGILVHTGQHYDEGMSDVFFRDLGIPRPDIHLGVGSGSHAEQTARIMTAFEKVCLDEKPDLILVVGDVNSTL